MTVADGHWLEFAGLRFQTLHTPGDLDDGLSLWFPQNQVVLTGDTVTHSHVHAILSTPRHEPSRDAQAFVDSMSRIEALNAKVLIGGHGQGQRLAGFTRQL
jgi:glyoxylase-like metal-dependent hydrolase (beta-lactamase superfamily II)